MKNEDSFFNRNLAVGRRVISFAIELRIVRFVFLEHTVNGGEQHPGNGDDCLLVVPALFQILIAAKDFRVFLLCFNGGKGTPHKQRLDMGPGTADPGGLFLPSALIVLRRKPSPGAKVL